MVFDLDIWLRWKLKDEFREAQTQSLIKETSFASVSQKYSNILFFRCSKKFKSHVQANKHLMDKHSDAEKPILKTEVDSDEAEMKDDDEDDEEDEEWPEGLEPAIALNIKEEAQEDAWIIRSNKPHNQKDHFMLRLLSPPWLEKNLALGNGQGQKSFFHVFDHGIWATYVG